MEALKLEEMKGFTVQAIIFPAIGKAIWRLRVWRMDWHILSKVLQGLVGKGGCACLGAYPERIAASGQRMDRLSVRFA
jgi:hypothetical protein